MIISIYHNPRCSKSRQTLELLKERGHSPDIIDYLEAPPDAATLSDLVAKLGLKPMDIIRTGEAAYKEARDEVQGMSEADLLNWLADNPQAMQRPIVVAGGRARIGRPPESVLDILP
jgi:arsenate reductase